jgi:hypothetical protein
VSLSSALAVEMWCTHIGRRPVCDVLATGEPDQMGNPVEVTGFEGKMPAAIAHAQATGQETLVIFPEGNNGTKGKIQERGQDGQMKHYRVEAPEKGSILFVACSKIAQAFELMAGNRNPARGEQRGAGSVEPWYWGARPYV